MSVEPVPGLADNNGLQSGRKGKQRQILEWEEREARFGSFVSLFEILFSRHLWLCLSASPLSRSLGSAAGMLTNSFFSSQLKGVASTTLFLYSGLNPAVSSWLQGCVYGSLELFSLLITLVSPAYPP